MAAVLAGGPGAVVSHRSAAALHGLDGLAGGRAAGGQQGRADHRPGGATGNPDITVARHRYNRIAGATVHRSSLSLDRVDVDSVQGIPVTTVTRTIVDLAAVVDLDTLELVVESALRSHRTTLDHLANRLDALARRGRPGVARLRRALARRGHARATDSALETRFVQLLRRAGLPDGSRHFAVSDDEGLIGYVDFAYPASKVLIELDGLGTHGTDRALAHDLRRQNRLGLRLPGWTLLRFTWHQVVDRGDEVVAVLRQALADQVPARTGRAGHARRGEAQGDRRAGG
ncbi:MAG: DUF559 domain-containing protein, partial [Acidimicrobiales bacterium]